jgi:hypothetical protein
MPFGSSGLGVVHASALVCLPCLSEYFLPFAVVSSMLSSASRVRYQDWLGRILAGSIGLYALAFAQSLAPRFGYSSLATVVLAAASGAEVEPAYGTA